MKRVRHLLLATILAFTPLAVSAQQTVKITQKASGRSVDVEFISVQAGVLSCKIGGKPYDIKITDLTPDSVDRLRELVASNPPAAPATPASPSAPAAANADQLALALQVNEAIGHDLFGEAASLWAEPAEAVAARLDWKLESKKKDNSSYRSYPKQEYLFLKTRPFCVTLYGSETHNAQRFSLVYANKGDFGSTVGMGEDHFKQLHPTKSSPKSLEDAIELDAQILSEALTDVLGEAEQQYYGERDDRRKVMRWDMGDHAFLLSTRDEEYTSLLIIPGSEADVEGKVKFVKDAVLKENHLKNIVRSDNGDVYVDNIPMVDQGPKGYCAPATFERAMRYMRVPADMYLLATSATAVGGGTNTRKLAEDCKGIFSSKARRMKDLDLKEDLDIKEVKKFVDKGVPILWQMCSLGGYNNIANNRSKERENVTDWSVWKADIAREAESAAPGLRAS
ncbi:MAG: hypothetical protein AAF226_16255, partial [Verrucomicrobiota bacterium]